MSSPTEDVVPVAQPKSKDWMGITAILLALAIIPVLAIDFDRLGLLWLGLILVIALSLGAVVLARRGLRAKDDGEASQRLPAATGRVLGWIGLGIAAAAVLFLVFLFVVFAAAGS